MPHDRSVVNFNRNKRCGPGGPHRLFLFLPGVRPRGRDLTRSSFTPVQGTDGVNFTDHFGYRLTVSSDAAETFTVSSPVLVEPLNPVMAWV